MDVIHESAITLSGFYILVFHVRVKRRQVLNVSVSSLRHLSRCVGLAGSGVASVSSSWFPSTIFDLCRPENRDEQVLAIHERFKPQ